VPYKDSTKQKAAVKLWAQENPQKMRGYTKKYEMEHPEVRRARSRRNYLKDPAAAIERSNKWAREHPEETKAREKTEAYRRTDVLYTYNLTAEEHDDILESQHWKCAFPNCGEAVTLRSPIDHDHQCCSRKGSCGNCIRGILCRWHNIALGFFEKLDIESALSYIGGKQ